VIPVLVLLAVAAAGLATPPGHATQSLIYGMVGGIWVGAFACGLRKPWGMR
jgi:hypothetical protein